MNVIYNITVNLNKIIIIMDPNIIAYYTSSC